MLDFKELFTTPRRSAKSYAELIPWFAQVSPGLVLCNDGSLLAAFEFEGADVQGLDHDEADSFIDRFETATRSFNDRITVWLVQDRRIVEGHPQSDYVSPVAQRIAQQWNASLSRHRNAKFTQTMFVAFKYPSASENFFESIQASLEENEGRWIPTIQDAFRRRFSEKTQVAKVRGRLKEMASEFEKLLTSFEGVASSSLGFWRLREDELLGVLYKRANMASSSGSVRNCGAFLNTSLASDTLIRQGDQLEFSGPTAKVYIAALSTNGMPAEAYGGYVDSLMKVAGEYVLVQCFRFIDRMAAQAAIQAAETFYKHEVKSVVTRTYERLSGEVVDKENTGNLVLAQDAQDALVELTAKELAYGYYNLTLLAVGKTARDAEDTADAIASSLRTDGFTVLRERQGLIAAFLASLPGHADSIMRWRLASIANLSDLAPLRSVSAGEPFHPFFSSKFGYEVPSLCRFLTQYGVTYDFNPHMQDVGHTAVIGGTGAGKTSLLTLLIAQFQKYIPSKTLIFDKDHSLMVPIVLMGGSYIEVSIKRNIPTHMNPVRVMMVAGDDNKLRSWLEVLIAAGGNTVSPQESQTLYGVIQRLRTSPEHTWRLSALYAQLKGESLALADKLAPYVDRSEDGDDDEGRGMFSGFFDNDEDKFALSSMVAMECGEILKSKELAGPFMDYVFYRVESMLDGVTPTLIYIEEAWAMFANPMFMAKIDDWWRTFRKKMAFVIFSTQSLDEIDQLPNIGAFMTSNACQILLPGMRSSIRHQADLYRKVCGLNDATLDLLAQAVPKRDYLIVKPGETRLVTTEMPPLLLALNQATSQPHVRAAALAASVSGVVGWENKFIKEVLDV